MEALLQTLKTRLSPSKLQANQTAFTIIEVMMVLTITSFLMSLVMTGFTGVRENSYEARMAAEFKTMRNGLAQYYGENSAYPPDVNRNIPPGIEEYLVADGADLDGWPDGPWPNSVYDYDAFIANGEPVYQISLRFCNANGTGCNFPKLDWAAGFDANSSAYYCIQGECKAHPSRPANHPGYCINCLQSSL